MRARSRLGLKYIAILVVVAASFSFSGCLTIISKTYGAALDTRSLKQQKADTAIWGKIKKKYYDDKDMKVLAISSYVFYGKVYLVGVYTDQKQRQKAIRLARKTEGVKVVIAHLLPKSKKDFCGGIDELKLKAKVKAKLIGDKTIWSTNVKVDTVQCSIVLLGLVKTKAEITKSIKHAKSIPGVRSVKSYLRTAKPR